MRTTFEKNTGISLIVGSVLMIVTLILHPAGGSLEHLIRIQKIIIISHSIAILSIPFSFIGFLGLTRRLGTENFFSIVAFSIMSFGLVAVMGAAATNGLALPIFVQHYEGASTETIEAIRPVMRYNFALNHAFDYIFMGAMCLAIFFWSIAIFRTGRFPQWLGYFGVILSGTAGLLLFSGFDFVGLQGFRIFIFGSVVWIILAGVLLYSNRN